MSAAAGAWPRDEVRTVVNADLRSNTYLLRCGATGDCVLVDPGLDRAALEQALAGCGWRPIAVLCTHGHFDHVGGAGWLQQAYQIPVYLPAADLKMAKMANFMMAAFGIKHRIALPEFQLVSEADPLVHCAALSLRYHPLPGHTPGSTVITVDDLLFSGDSLYARRTGLSRLPGEDHELLRTSLAGLFAWADGGARVLPGHGGSATLDDIQLHNDELRAFMAAGVKA